MADCGYMTTIGVYGFTEEDFFCTLQDARVDVFYDIRWRRGVRGSNYAFANHKRLKYRLDSLGIEYRHRRDLAPTPEIRQIQAHKDQENLTTKRKRTTLSPEFSAAYEEKVLRNFDALDFAAALPEHVKVLALFCVERDPEACHRLLVAEKLRGIPGSSVVHLLP